MPSHKKTQKPRKKRRPLPKVGSPADEEYRLRHGREDLLDFGLARPKRGAATWVVAAVVVLLLAVGVIGLIALT